MSHLFNVYGGNDVRQTEVRTVEPLLPERSAFEDEIAIKKLKRHKSRGIVQILAELIKAGGRKVCSEIHNFLILFGKEVLPEEWKEPFIVPLNKKGDKTDCSNYRGISVLSTIYKMLPNILLSKLTPYAEEIIWYHQNGFRHNRSTADHIFCIRQILEEKWEYNEPVHQLFIDFRKAYDSVRREVLCNIFFEFGITMILVRLIKMCLNVTYSRVWLGKLCLTCLLLRMV